MASNRSANECRNNVLNPVGGSPPLQFVFAYVLPCFILVGLIANALTLMTLNVPTNKRSKRTNRFLSAKSIADFGVGVFALFFNMKVYIAIVDNDSFTNRFYQFVFKPAYVGSNWLLMSSTWFAVAVTFERMFAVGWPLRARHVLTTRLSTICIVTIPVASFLLTMYPVIYMKTVAYMDCARPGRMVYLLAGPLSRKQPGLWYYGLVSRYIHHITAIVIPVLLLINFNTVIVLQLRSHSRSLARFTQAGYNLKDANEQLRVSLVAFCITLATAMFLLPSSAIVVYDTIHRGVKSQTYQAFTHVSNLLVLCDKLLDFFLYCMVSSNFRTRLVAACKHTMSHKRWKSTSEVSKRRTQNGMLMKDVRYQRSASADALLQTTCPTRV